MPNLILNVKLQYNLFVILTGKTWFILGLLDQLCPKYQQVHIHMAVEKHHFLCSGESPVRWFKAIYHIAKEEFWGQTNWEDRNWRGRQSIPIVAGLHQLGVLHLAWNCQPKLQLLTLLEAGSLEAAEREGMMDATWCFLQTGGIIMKYSCCHRPQCQVSGGS